MDGKPVVNRWRSLRDIPPQTPLSLALSKELRRRGFRFVELTIVAFMQATGMVNDHVVDCFRHAQVARKGHEGRVSDPLPG